MDLLLTHGYFLYEDPKELQIMKPYAPLGILYLCSHLRQHGFAVEVFDTTFAKREELIRVLQSETPAVLGVYGNLMTRKNVVEILQIARSSGWTCVVGGPEPGAYAREYLEAGAHVVVFGEGEVTLQELLPVLQRREFSALAQINGIAYFDHTNEVHTTNSRAPMRDLDAQPWPAREAIDTQRYVATWRQAHGQGSVSLITARGCPYRCNWCSHQVYGQTHRRRNPLKVVDEIAWLASTYQPDMMWIADDVFTIHHGWIRQFAAEMRRRSLHIPFECITRADRLNSEVADLLAELGCFRIWIGSESGSQRILDAMQRDVTLQEIQAAVELCRTYRIQTGMFLMWGYDGEEMEDINATVEHVKKSNPDIFFTTVAYPIKGTPYYERVGQRLVQLNAWSKTSDREIAISGRHSRRFYEFADSLLRDEVALEREQRKSQVSIGIISELQRKIDAARQGLQATRNEVEA